MSTTDSQMTPVCGRAGATPAAFFPRGLKPVSYRWIHHGGRKLLDVGIGADGAVLDPHGYGEHLVLEAIEAATARRHARRVEAAQRAAGTRRTRRERKVHDIARRWIAGEDIGPRQSCALCGRVLADPESIERGIGSECWDGVLATLTELRASR